MVSLTHPLSKVNDRRGWADITLSVLQIPDITGALRFFTAAFGALDKAAVGDSCICRSVMLAENVPGIAVSVHRRQLIIMYTLVIAQQDQRVGIARTGGAGSLFE